MHLRSLFPWFFSVGKKRPPPPQYFIIAKRVCFFCVQGEKAKKIGWILNVPRCLETNGKTKPPPHPASTAWPALQKPCSGSHSPRMVITTFSHVGVRRRRLGLWRSAVFGVRGRSVRENGNCRQTTKKRSIQTQLRKKDRGPESLLPQPSPPQKKTPTDQGIPKRDECWVEVGEIFLFWSLSELDQQSSVSGQWKTWLAPRVTWCFVIWGAPPPRFTLVTSCQTTKR